MRAVVMFIRGIELFFLFVIVVNIYLAPDGTILITPTFLNIEFNFWIGTGPYLLSSLTIGYLFSIIGTLLQRENFGTRGALIKTSLVLSSVGLASQLFEILRIVIASPIQIQIDFPIVIVIIDIILLGRLRSIDEGGSS